MASSPPGSPSSKPPSSHGHQQTSPTDLFASAKVVAEATRFGFSNQSDKIDKRAAAEAAEDLLAAASQYGNLDDQKGIGSYVEKAESYLHQYHSSDSTTPAADAPTSTKPASTTHQSGDDDDTKAEVGGGGSTAHQSGGDDDDTKAEEGGGGFGGYFKVAEGFLKKY